MQTTCVLRNQPPVDHLAPLLAMVVQTAVKPGFWNLWRLWCLFGAKGNVEKSYKDTWCQPVVPCPKEIAFHHACWEVVALLHRAEDKQLGSVWPLHSDRKDAEQKDGETVAFEASRARWDLHGLISPMIQFVLINAVLWHGGLSAAHCTTQQHSDSSVLRQKVRVLRADWTPWMKIENLRGTTT